ncbi:OmpA family protein [Mucilaginibacter agri]|uniref:OmpA family protein n=1 Tax=Mucilaginibacter agri TaxID=2695265 RepID=A0A965ZK36_9SPHI|nr:OmpA family protein [Mucilaginibacter agri]NCD72140.1 OmpA family protein [Mucilaginibacter agri]
MKKSLLFIVILFIASTAFAQYNPVNFKAMADKAFHNKDYYEAAYYYRKAAEGLKITPETKVPFQPDNSSKEPKGKAEDLNYIRYQLADSYRLYENYLEAEPWYYQVVNENAESKYPLVRLWYGICLRADQHFDEAIQQFELFQKNYHGDIKLAEMATKEIENCRFAKEQYQYPILLAVNKLKGQWNSDGSNYAVVRRDNNFYFTSSRFLKSDKKHLNRIYHTTAEMVKPEIINFRDAGSDKETEYGTPSLSPNGNRLYLTRWYKTGTKIVHAIYKSDWTENGGWTSPQKLNANVNADGFNAIQPFVCKDGKTMFFVSNKPGGQGGYDLWLANLDSNGNPTSSINMGPTINTSMDEQAPYYDEGMKRLIYSSKGFIGLGGFDFFESNGEPGRWNTPRNMGYPMNSAKDDLYYSPDPNNENKFYVSSDRESDCCLELFEVQDQRYFAAGFLVDCNTHKPLGGASVSLIDSLSKDTLKQVTLDATGKYWFKITTKRPYMLKFEKDGYFAKVLPLTMQGKMSADTLFSPDICLQAFVVNKPIVINNILYDFGKSTLRPESETELDGLVIILRDNPKFKIELSSHTDSIGSDAYNQKLSQDRAQSCVDYIVSKGIDEARIFAKGYGKTKPIAPNSMPDGKDNPDGRQLNRRTEFTVLKTD